MTAHLLATRAASASGLPALFAALATLLTLSLPCRADMPVALDAAPGVVHLPDNWRPIPRAEIVEAHERAASATPGRASPLPTAAFQRLPTLQWFSLPHVLLYWLPAADAAPTAPPAPPAPPALPASSEQPAADLRLAEVLGRSPRGVVHLWQLEVLRPDGRFRLDLLTPDEDGRAVLLGMAEGLRAP